MEIASALLGRREFYSKSEIISYCRFSKNFEGESENLSNADAVVIFQTSKQKTWIVSTSQRMYCILDDLRKEKPNINWSIPKEKIVSGGEVVLEIKPKEKPEESNQTGLVDFGADHRNWLYTKDLFAEARVDMKIRDLVTKQML